MSGEPRSDIKTAEEVFQLLAEGIDAGEAMVFTRTIPASLDEYMSDLARKFGIEVVSVGEDEFREETKDTRFFLLPISGLLPGAKGVVALGFRDGVGLFVLTWYYLVGYGIGDGYTYFIRITPEEKVIVRLGKVLFMAASTKTITG